MAYGCRWLRTQRPVMVVAGLLWLLIAVHMYMPFPGSLVWRDNPSIHDGRRGVPQFGRGDSSLRGDASKFLPLDEFPEEWATGGPPEEYEAPDKWAGEPYCTDPEAADMINVGPLDSVTEESVMVRQ